MASVCVEVEGVGKRFGDVDALVDLSLTLGRGEVVALLGANGSGKSTLLRMIAGMVTPDAGRIVVEGHDVARDRRQASGLIGSYLDSARCWYPRISGRANLQFHARLRGLAPDAATRAAADELASVGLEGAADRRVATYSAGMRARLALARARLGDPSVLLLDEPTATLDVRSVEEFERHVLDEDRGRTILLATHDPEEAARLATVAVVLDAGRVADRMGPQLSATTLQASLAAR